MNFQYYLSYLFWSCSVPNPKSPNFSLSENHYSDNCVKLGNRVKLIYVLQMGTSRLFLFHHPFLTGFYPYAFMLCTFQKRLSIAGLIILERKIATLACECAAILRVQIMIYWVSDVVNCLALIPCFGHY